MRTWFRARYLPVLIGGFMLVMPWAYLGWNTTVGELIPAIRFRTKQTIAGLVTDSGDDLSWRTVTSGRYQQSLSRAVGILSPIFKPAIHWRNQAYYTLFGAAPGPRIVVGKGEQLLEIVYLEEYCKRDRAIYLQQFETWAGRIRQVQDFFEARGQAFLYVVTPSKVAQYPQFIPSNFACPSDAASRADKLPAWTAAMEKHGVHFVNAAAMMAPAERTYGIGMFPRGGIHWNTLGAAVATQAVIAAINAQGRGPKLPTFTFDFTISYRPRGTDRDLLDIMNLPYPDTHYPVPELTYHSEPPPGGCQAVRISEVGGSFLGLINNTLERIACPPEIDYWFYWDQTRLRLAGGNPQSVSLPITPDLRRQSLLEANVVIFEENEAAGPETSHGKALMEETRLVRQGS